MMSQAHYRQLALSLQGLQGSSSQFAFGSGLEGSLRAIEHLGYVQIDTLSVVERAHHHTLWNRVPEYDVGHLNQLVREKRVFEYWFHAAAYLPMRDYRYALPQMAVVAAGEHRYYRNADPHLMRQILAVIKGQGPSRSRELGLAAQFHRSSNAPWSRGPVRRAVEQLFMQGDIMVCARHGMEKVYDLSEHCLADDIDLRPPSPAEYAEYRLDTLVRSHGVVSLKQLVHLNTGRAFRDTMRQLIQARLDSGELSVLDALPDTYFSPEPLRQLVTPLATDALHILSPFDNVVIHRERLSQLFGFHYTMESYLPAHKRVFGYFCLPIVWGDRLVARIDCKALRAEHCLSVLSLHLEPDLASDRDEQSRFATQLALALQRFAAFNQCDRVALAPAVSEAFSEALSFGRA